MSNKKKIEILDKDIYICDECHCMLRVPKELIEEEEVEEDEETKIVGTFECPNCEYNNIAYELEEEEEEEEKPKKTEKPEKKSKTK